MVRLGLSGCFGVDGYFGNMFEFCIFCEELVLFVCCSGWMFDV